MKTDHKEFRLRFLRSGFPAFLMRILRGRGIFEAGRPGTARAPGILPRGFLVRSPVVAFRIAGRVSARMAAPAPGHRFLRRGCSARAHARNRASPLPWGRGRRVAAGEGARRPTTSPPHPGPLPKGERDPGILRGARRTAEEVVAQWRSCGAWIRPRQAPVSRPRVSRNFLKRSRSLCMRFSITPSASATFSARPSGS